MEQKIIDIRQVFKKLLKYKKRIFRITVVGFVVGAIFSFGVPRTYMVTSKIAPELSLRTNSLTSFAQIAGINNLLSNNNDALLPSVYPDIVMSTPFLAELSTMPVNDSTLYWYLLNDTKKSWLGTIISLPSMAIGGIKSMFSEEDTTSVSVIDPYRPTSEQDAVLKMLRKLIMVDVDKKNFLVTISVTAQDPAVAADLAQMVIANLKKTVINYRTEKAKNNVEYLEGVTRSSEEDYYKAQREYAYYLDHNQNIISRSDLVQGESYRNNVNLKFQLYSSLASELQQARTKVMQETPVFAEIAPPSVPLKSSNSRKSFALAFALIAFLGGCIHVFMKK